jgi:hypothetical protein
MSCELAAQIPPDSPLAHGWRHEMAQLALRFGLAESLDVLAQLAEFLTADERRRHKRPRVAVLADQELDPLDTQAPARRRINRKRYSSNFDPHRLLYS